MQAVDPARAARRSAEELRAGSTGAEPVAVEVVAPLPFVRADRAVLAQVLGNLIANAGKFRRGATPLNVTVRAERRGDRVRIWVEDDGIGIAPEHQVRIYNVFERLHGQEIYPGTGVGLAIVKAGVERMDGTFGVNSALGEGSSFWIELAEADDGGRDAANADNG